MIVARYFVNRAPVCGRSVILARPGPIVCGIQRFGVGVGFAVTYAALLTKTNRIARIFDSARHSAKRPPFISPRSQVSK